MGGGGHVPHVPPSGSATAVNPKDIGRDSSVGCSGTQLLTVRHHALKLNLTFDIIALALW